MQNAFVESFNGSFCDELLNETLFLSLVEVREKITAGKDDYNRLRPHSSLGNLAPQEFALKSRQETKAAEGHKPPTDSSKGWREVGSQVMNNGGFLRGFFPKLRRTLSLKTTFSEAF